MAKRGGNSYDCKIFVKDRNKIKSCQIANPNMSMILSFLGFVLDELIALKPTISKNIIETKVRVRYPNLSSILFVFLEKIITQLSSLKML